jgi:general secretion pathway protein L
MRFSPGAKNARDAAQQGRATIDGEAMKFDFNRWRQRLRDAANRAGLLRFWRWWMSELGPLLPDAWRAALQRRFTRPVIEFANGEVLIWRPEFSNTATRLALAETVSLIGDAAAVLAAGRAAVARLARTASGGIAMPRVAVALGPRQVLRKELVLPAAVEDNLAQTLGYDLDRHTPFRPEQLYFDAVVVGRDTGKKTIRVDWAAALKTVVDDACKQVRDWGAVPVSVVPGPPAPGGTRLNLIPGTARVRPLQWGRWQVWVPLAAVAVVALAAVAVPLVQKRQYAIALIAANAEAAQRAQAADAVRQQLDSMQNEYNYILARKYAYPSIVHLLDEVTRVLPDDTWLTQFELKSSGRGKDAQRDVYLRGETADAGKLIALLEDSQLVEQAAPRSPTTKIQGASGEVFDLSARLRTLALPAPVAVAMADAPAALPPPSPPPPAQAASPEPTPAAPTTATPAGDAAPPAAAASAAAPPAAAPAPSQPASSPAQSERRARHARPAPAAATAPVLPHASAFGAADNGTGRAPPPTTPRAAPASASAPAAVAAPAAAPPSAVETPASPPVGDETVAAPPPGPKPDAKN